MQELVCGFAGLGLIGGSIAKALKENLSDIRIIAYDVNKQALYTAKKEQMIDDICESLDERFRQCDYIFLCAPVQKNTENLSLLKDHLSPECILTDVGSVKTGIHKQVERLGLTAQFIGGHPMTGSERYGYVNAKSRLLENAYYILTPTGQTPEEKISAYSQLVKTLGAIPLVLDPAQHDYVTAAVSHLPHIIASSLVNLVKDSDSSEGIMKMIAAGGFKDITRIASSSAAMWQQICLTNTENISGLLGNYIESLCYIKEQLDSKKEDELYVLFDSARIYRDSFAAASSGPIKISYTLHVDIADETGALASIATILALNNISIKNIGIVHNREIEEGSLAIEFYDEAIVKKAKSILEAKGYGIYEKKI